MLPDGTRTVLDQVLADDEHELQERLKDQPDLLPVEELGLVGAPIVVGRETRLPSGAIDLVLLDRAGSLCLVEFKTGPQNPDFRSCLAQLVDYGSDLWGMTLEDFETKVAVRYFTSKQCPPEAPGYQQTSLNAAAANAWPTTGEGADPFDWRDGLTTGLAWGGFRYVVVAQRFAPQVLTTIRYLNATMPRARFDAVELVRFDVPVEHQKDAGLNVTFAVEHPLVGAYETRHLMGPERARTPAGDRAKALANSAELLARVEDETYQGALEQLITGFEQMPGLDIFYGTTGISLRVPLNQGAISVGWFFPPGPPRWLGLTDLTLGYYTVGLSLDVSKQAALDAYATVVNSLPGAKPARKPTFNAATFGPEAVILSYPSLLAAVEEVVTTLSLP
jgi:hypothetical protein